MTEYCELTGIITGSPEKIPQWQKKYGIKDSNVYSYDNMQRIADNDDIDVIYVVTPTGTHANFTIEAARTGKHVWCEKPMAMNVEECQRMIDECNKNNVKLTLGYRVQHEPNTLTLNSYADILPFGKMLSADAAAGYRGGGGTGWRFQRDMGGGALYDMGVYTVNGLRNAVKMEPVKVLQAAQYTNRPEIFKEVDETTEYVVEFANGMKARGKTSVGENMNHLRVTAEKGWYEMRPMQTYNGVEGLRSDGVKLNTPVKNQQALQMDDDAKAILSSKPMPIDPMEGLQDIRVIEAIIASARSGGVVEI
jgi:glucose-fructose oxidoreductase